MTVETKTEDQPTTEAEPGKAGGGEGAGIEPEAQPEGQAGSEDTKELPKELEETRKQLLRDYHKKTQALAEERKTLESDSQRYRQDAEALYSLSQQEWFKNAVAAEKNRRNGRSLDISDEDFEAIKIDKRAFQDFLNKRDKSITEGLESKFKAEFESLSKEQQKFVTEKEFDIVAREYGQAFKDANEAGELEGYLKKDYDYETAFKLLMQDKGQVAKKASAKEPNSSKAGAVEKTGMPAVRGGPVAKAKNLDEALQAAFEMARKGQKDYKIERS